MTHLPVWILVSVAGGIGATLRFVLDGLIRQSVHIAYPLGTTVINFSGSFALGMLTGSAEQMGIPHYLLLILGGGLMGGYTTFSTASLETVRLAQERRIIAAATNGLGMLVLCIGGSLAGLSIGQLM